LQQLSGLLHQAEDTVWEDVVRKRERPKHNHRIDQRAAPSKKDMNMVSARRGKYSMPVSRQKMKGKLSTELNEQDIVKRLAIGKLTKTKRSKLKMV